MGFFANFRGNMVCLKANPQGGEVLTDYCAGALGPNRAAELEAHLAQCADCRELVAAQCAVWEALEAWRPVEVSPDFDARLYARIAVEARGTLRPPWWRRVLHNALIPAAAIVAVMGLALIMEAPEKSVAPVRPAAPAVSSERIDLQQVQQALDDLELLTPIDPASSSAM